MKVSEMLSAMMLGSAMLASSSVMAGNSEPRENGRGGEGAPTVYVTSQGLYYDSIVVADPLPMKGRFQQLIPGEMGLMTEYGPGQPGHLGGRWWVDLNQDGIMDKDDHFFLCPLLGPGRETL